MNQVLSATLDFLGVEVDPVVPVSDLLSFVLICGTIVVGIVSLRKVQKTIKQAATAAKTAHYSELDRFYAELLELALDEPNLRKPKGLKSDRAALIELYTPFRKRGTVSDKYDIYAFMIWNFIETIHDRCQELCDSCDDEGYRSLRGTWQPIIVAENAIHRGWMLAEMRREYRRSHDKGRLNGEVRRDKFCNGFYNFVLRSQWYRPDWTYQERYTGLFEGMDSKSRPVETDSPELLLPLG